MVTPSWDEAKRKRSRILWYFSKGDFFFADVIHCILLYKHRQGTIERRRVVASRCHGIHFWISQTVVLQLLQEKNWREWLSCAWQITLRNKTVARQWKWLSLSKKIVEMQKCCYHRNVTSHFSLSWWKWTFSPSVFYNIMWQSQEI